MRLGWPIVIAGFLAWCVSFRGFVLDDSFITFRIAENVAAGHGFVWNVGGPAVDASTSILWTWLLVAAYWIGPDGILLPALLGATFGLATLVLLGQSLERQGTDRRIVLVLVGWMALNPFTALQSVQGLETMLASLLALAATVVAVRGGLDPDRRTYRTLVALLFLFVLTRPEGVVFAAPLLLAYVYLARQSGARAMAARVMDIAMFAVVPGVLVLAWKYWVFGGLLPTAFYVKASSGLALPAAVELFRFFMLGIVPVAAWALARGLGSEERVKPLLPALLAASIFLAYTLTVEPLQARLWRFQFPMGAVLLFLVGAATRRPVKSGHAGDAGAGTSRSRPVVRMDQAVAVGIVALLLLFPLTHVGTADGYVAAKSAEDRADAGRALQPFADRGYRMMSTQAGALPYYSEWNSVDNLGLLDPDLARGGYDRDFLDDYDPDVLMFAKPSRSLVQEFPGGTNGDFLRDHAYRLAAVMEKNPASVHVYWVAADNPEAEEIACALQGVRGHVQWDVSELAIHDYGRGDGPALCSLDAGA